MKYVFFWKTKDGQYWGKFRGKNWQWSNRMGPYDHLFQARFFVRAHFNIEHFEAENG